VTALFTTIRILSPIGSQKNNPGDTIRRRPRRLSGQISINALCGAEAYEADQAEKHWLGEHGSVY
jgi:hypothetical protein